MSALKKKVRSLLVARKDDLGDQRRGKHLLVISVEASNYPGSFSCNESPGHVVKKVALFAIL
jgi:hypothetical protein